MKNRKPVKWVYDYNSIGTLKGDISFKKGLGSWKETDLNTVIKTDGLDKMLMILKQDTKTSQTIKDWFDTSASDIRKQKIIENDFDLIKL